MGLGRALTSFQVVDILQALGAVHHSTRVLCSALRYLSVRWFIWGTVVLALPIHTLAEGCKQLSDGTRTALLSYATDYYQAGSRDTLHIVRERLDPITCSTRVSIESSAIPTRLTLFVSPDGHFASKAELVNLDQNAQVIANRQAQETEQMLMSSGAPSKGDNNAVVTVAVFSDFECPFCQRFNDLLNQLPSQERAKVKLVFINWPIRGHKWAGQAASLGVCMATQNRDVFWRVHDWLFNHQGSINQANLMSEVHQAFKNDAMLDWPKLEACLDSSTPREVLDREHQLGTDLDVVVTPTVFINGQRQRPIRDIDGLITAIEQNIRKQRD